MTDRDRIAALLEVMEWAEEVPEYERHWQALDAIINGERCFVFDPETGQLERVIVTDEAPGPMSEIQVQIYRAICAYRNTWGRAPTVDEIGQETGLSSAELAKQLTALRGIRRIVVMRKSERPIRVVG